MRKRKVLIIGILLILVALAAAWRFPAAIYVPLGVARHEAFYDGKPTSYWVRAFKREPFLGQVLSAGDTGKILREGGPAAVPVLCEMVKNPDPDLRSDALFALAAMGPEARAAQPALGEAVSNETQSARFVLASRTLGKLNPAAATEVLNTVLRDKAASNGSRRAWALLMLLEIAPDCQAALPVLNEIALSQAEDVRLRVAAVRVLWRLHQPAEPLATALCETLAAENTPAGVQALSALGEIGPGAKVAVPTLMKILARPSLPAMGQPFGPPHRMVVVIALGKIGPAARPAIPAIIASLKSGNEVVRLEAALALAKIDSSAAREALAARDAAWGATLAILAARPPAGLAVPPLVEVFRRSWIPAGLQTREEIREAIAKIDPGAKARTRLPSFNTQSPGG
jgi:HEAT repeat protein